jgi:hypothetical protein
VASSLITAVVVAFSLVAVLTLISALRQVKARGEWSGTATFGLVMVLLTISFVELFVTYFGLWTKERNAFHTISWVVPGMAHQLMRVFVLLLGVMAVVVFFVRLKQKNTPINIPAVLFVLVGIASAESALMHGDNPFRPLSMIFVAVTLACTVAPRGMGIHIGVGTACMIFAIGSGFTFIFNREFSVFSCTSDTYTSDKCGLLNFDFRGILENENALAMFLALAMPFIYIAFAGWQGKVLSAYVLGLTLMTGSRSGMTAAAVTFLALIVLRPNIRKPAPTRVRTGLVHLGLAGALVIGFATPFVTNDPTAYHGRAALWMLVRSAIADPETLLYGTGMLGWQHVRDSGLIDPNAAYSVHNEWLQVLYTTGIIGVVLFLTALGVLLWQARPQYSLVVGCVLIPVFVLGGTERPWPTDTCDWLTWAIPAALLSYPAVRRRSADGVSRHPHDEDSSIRTWRADMEVVR